MKKRSVYRRILAVLVIMCMLFTCCIATASAEESPLSWKIKTYNKEWKLEDGSVYMSVSYSYPIFSGTNTTAVNKLNSYYEAQYNDFMADIKKNLEYFKDAALEFGPMVSPDYHSSEEVTCNVTKVGKYISVVQHGYEYWVGAAHGMPYMVTAVHSASTGSKMTAKTLLKVADNATVNKIAGNLYSREYMRQECSMYGNEFFAETLGDFKESLKGMDFYKTFYLDENGNIVFYAGPYQMAPYASGFIEVSKKIL